MKLDWHLTEMDAVRVLLDDSIEVVGISYSGANVSPRSPTDMVQEERRRRRLLAENRRMQRFQSRRKGLRLQRELLQLERDQKILEWRHILRAGTEPPHHRDKYLALVAQADQLHAWNRALREEIERLVLQTTTLSTTFSVEVQPSIDVQPATVTETHKKGSFVIDPVTIMEMMVHADPLTVPEAETFVEMSCHEMRETLSRSDWVFEAQHEGWGLQHDYKLRGNNVVLPFCMATHLPRFSADELMEKTWSLLTDLDGYRRIQPQATNLKVIQRVFPGCCVVGIAVGEQSSARHSLVLIARAAVHGGRLIAFRSVPLARTGSLSKAAARQSFIEHETQSCHATTFSWYNFQDRRTSGEAACDVFFGGIALNQEPNYLRRLYLDISSGFSRWRSAVGAPHLLFSEPMES